MLYGTHDHTPRKHRRISARYHHITYAESSVARNVVHISLIGCASRPVKVSEITLSAYGTADIGVRIEHGDDHRIMFGHKIDNAHDSETARHAHVFPHSVGIALVYCDEVVYNDSLLGFYGVTNYSNLVDTLASLIIIILALVSIACIIVIYNSFAISVMERKKQFGLFSSIGATRKQLKYTVFFEAFIVGIIGIPLGVLSAYLGIGIVLKIVNYLLPNVFDFPLALTTYPLFIIIPILFMIITIII